MAKFVYSSSPHIKSPATTRRIMIDVCIALLPACIAGCVLMGLNPVYTRLGWLSFMQLAICCVSSVVAEFVYLLCCKKSFKTILKEFDFTSLVTGLLIGMNLYPTSKWYVGILASVFAIVVVKMLFGGTGKNIVNPAIAGRIFAFIAFGAAFGGSMGFVKADGSAGAIASPVSGGKVTAGATPLQILMGADGTSTLTNLDLFLGTGVAGCIGEVCKLALIVGGIYLVIRGVLNFRWPLVYILTTGVVAVIIAWIDGVNALDPNLSAAARPVMVEKCFTDALGTFLPSILSGGLILGAIFMATDYVTTPNTKLGNYIYFVLLGILTAVLRKAVKGEAVSFAILLMNLLVPLFDMYIRRKPFGYVKPVKEKKVKKSEQKEGE